MIRYKRSSPRPHYDAVQKALTCAGGVVDEAARALQMDSNNLRKYIRVRPRLREIVENLRADMVDRAERCVSKAIDAGDLKAALYTLSTLGRSRGYSARDLSLGDVTNNVVIGAVNIVPMKSGEFISSLDRDGDNVLGGRVIEHEPKKMD
jgi:hypothetical protein